MNKKVIALIRTSTDRQEVESQRAEVLSFIKSDGFTEDEIIVIGESGASAIKMDKKYIANINKVYQLIETTPSIECVYAWSIDRIGRNETVLINFKNFLISHHVNLKIKEPTVYLLNEDGTVNNGMEIAFTLFITLAKQEMEQKKARFKRAKERNHREGKFNGGAETRFGYSVDNNGYFVINPEEAQIVQLIYKEYSTGKWSITKLANELNDRGISFRGKRMNDQRVYHILEDITYIGEGNKAPIIDKELFNKVREVVSQNRSPLLTKERKHIHLATGLIKCPQCGNNYIACFDRYVCYKARYSKRLNSNCNNDITIRIDIVDKIIWEVALEAHKKYLSKVDKASLKDLEKQEEILNQKVQTEQDRLSKLKAKGDRIEELYLENGDRAKYDKNMAKLSAETTNIKSKLESYFHQTETLQSMYRQITNPNKELSINNDSDKKKIVVQHIKNINIERIPYLKHWGYQITVNNEVYIYYPFKKKGNNIFKQKIPAS